jgi:hypothetical protein
MPHPTGRRSRSVLLTFTGLTLLLGGETLRRGCEARPFLPAPVYDVGHNPQRLVAADFNGDGRTDLAVANAGNTGETVTVGLLIADGGGLYRPHGVVYSSGAAATSPVLAGGDFNLDGKADLILETGFGTSFLAHVLLGQGNGTFTPVPTLALPGPLAVDDCNADGRLDLLVRSGSGTSTQLRVWLGAGNGTFSALAAFPAPAGIDFSLLPFAVADLTGDRIADVVATNALRTASVVFRGTAGGTFIQGQTIATTSPALLSVLADAGGDGVADLLVRVTGTNTMLRAWRGHGDGTFDATPFWSSVVSPFLANVAVGDLNRDGSPDLATVTRDETQLWLGNGVSFTPGAPFSTGLEAVQALIADLDGTGGLDLAVAGAASNTATVVLARASGSYVPALLSPLDPIASVVDLLVADFNADGRDDVAALHREPPLCDEPPCPWGEVEVRLAQPAGGYAITSVSIVDNITQRLHAADLDLDGKIDLFTVNLIDDGMDAIIDPGSLSLLRGHGDGTFDAAVAVPAGQWPNDAAAGDLDHDGDVDLVEADNYSSTVMVHLRSGAGTYAAQPPIVVGRAPIQVDLADVDGDATPDLVVTSRGKVSSGIPGEVSWLRGHGNGTFDPRVVLFQAENPAGLAAADLDGDGDVDFAVSNAGDEGGPNPADPGETIVLLHQGGATFTPSLPYRAGFIPGRPRLADLNGDGGLDLLVETQDHTLVVFPGLGAGLFGAAERFASLSCFGFRAGRLAGDGDTDLFGTCLNLATFENEADQNPDLRVIDNTHLAWNPISLVSAWDTIQGSLPLLRSTGGNFGAAVQACLQNNGALHAVDIAAVPPVGGGFFYLVRAVRPNGSPGSYDGEMPGQAAPRDASIQASAGACP